LNQPHTNIPEFGPCVAIYVRIRSFKEKVAVCPRDPIQNLVRSAIVVLVLVIGGRSQSSNAIATNQPHTDGAKGKVNGKTGADIPTKPAPSQDDPLVYRIGVEDELGISVWHEPDLSTNVVVRPDGMITLPLLNDLPVTGMTTKDLQDALTAKLKASGFLKEPQVTVIVRQIHSRRVYLVGRANKPGIYGLNDSKTVLQLLAEAGGPAPYAKLGAIYIIRQQGGTRQRLTFNYKKAISGKDLSDDLVLQPGDMVVVP
jgi:polysaccharide export outer membrane protein